MMKPPKTRPCPTDPSALRRLASIPGAPAPSTDWIGDGLRQLYRQVVDEPLPEALASLLERLDESPAHTSVPPERK